MKLELLKDVKRIITHANCPDGMASAIILYMAFRIEPEFYFHGNSDYLEMEATPGMLFCDITPPAHRYKEFVDAGAIVLDHHKGVEDIVKAFGERGVFADEVKEPGVSGALLAWREILTPRSQWSLGPSLAYLLIQKMKEFATLVGIRDTWQDDHPDFLKASQQAAMLTHFSWSYWKRNIEMDLLNFDTDEQSIGVDIFNKRLKQAEACVNNSVIFNSSNYKVAVFNDTDRLCSDAASILRKRGVDIIAGFSYFTDSSEIKIGYTLRSNDKFNVANLASFYNGGGHSKSAGFSISTNMEDVNPFLKFKELLEVYALPKRNE